MGRKKEKGGKKGKGGRKGKGRKGGGKEGRRKIDQNGTVKGSVSIW